MEKIVLITGASSGIGLFIAEYLSGNGYKVYAAARSYKNVENTGGTEGKNGLEKLYMDVTDQASIDEAVKLIIAREGRLDVLINCAAIVLRGAVEDNGIGDYEKILATNFYGTLRACKSVLPFMRERKSGMIINFSSLNGIAAVPFLSGYAVSKFAVEGLSETLSTEVKDFGIKVVIIEPGDHRGGSRSTRYQSEKAGSQVSPYFDPFSKTVERVEKDEADGSDPALLAVKIRKIIENPKPRVRYKQMAAFEYLFVYFKKYLPGRAFEKLLCDYYFKDLVVFIPRDFIENPFQSIKNLFARKKPDKPL